MNLWNFLPITVQHVPHLHTLDLDCLWWKRWKSTAGWPPFTKHSWNDAAFDVTLRAGSLSPDVTDGALMNRKKKRTTGDRKDWTTSSLWLCGIDFAQSSSQFQEGNASTEINRKNTCNIYIYIYFYIFMCICIFMCIHIYIFICKYTWAVHTCRHFIHLVLAKWRLHLSEKSAAGCYLKIGDRNYFI